MPQEINIAMLGARAVGKTSLLTAMYEQFENTIGQTNLQLIPDSESSALLQEKLGQLISLVDDFEASGGVSSNYQEQTFTFDLGQKGSQPFLTLNFKDYKGGLLNPNSLQFDPNSVQKIINNALVILIAIDAPALMEAKGEYHDLINRPLQIKNLIAKAFQDLKSPRLVILAPIKCEKYVQDEKSATELLRRVREGYSNLLTFLSSDLLLPWVATVVTPIQTVGTVVFSRIEFKDGDKKNPHFYFHKTSHDAKYSPKDSEQPFRYILRFLLKLEMNNRSSSWWILSFLRPIFNLDQQIKESAQKVAKDCKANGKGGFAILQGEKHLTL